MRKWLSRWLRLLFAGALLYGTSASGCLSDALNDLSDEIDDWAADLDGDEEDFEDWLDNVF